MSARFRAVSICFFLIASTALADPSRQELAEQIEQMKAQIQRIEAANQQTLDPRDVDATVDNVLADAEKRSTPLADVSGFTAGNPVPARPSSSSRLWRAIVPIPPAHHLKKSRRG